MAHFTSDASAQLNACAKRPKSYWLKVSKTTYISDSTQARKARGQLARDIGAGARDALREREHLETSRAKKRRGESALLQSLLLGVVADEIFKNCEDVLAVAHDALKQRPQGRLAHCFAVPLREHRRRHSNVAPQFVGGMTAQEQPVEKRGLSLRELEVLQWVVERIGLGRH